jgi:hypothetical protein
MKNLIITAILMVVTINAQSQIFTGDSVKIPNGAEFKELDPKEIREIINFSGQVKGFAHINVSNLDLEKVRSIIKGVKSIQEIIDKVGPTTTLVEYLERYKKTTTVSGFYYSFIPDQYDPSYINLTIAWTLKNCL